MSKHTSGIVIDYDDGTRRGPWEIHDGGRFGNYGDFGPTVCALTGEDTCQILFQIVGPKDPEECRANAALIAAAPDLLGALDKLLVAADYLAGRGFVGAMSRDKAEECVLAAVKDARAAIRRATEVMQLECRLSD